MPRRLLGVLIVLLVSVVGRAQGEPALLRLKEFRRKVAVAEKMRLDTLPAFRMQLEHYRQALSAKDDKAETAYQSVAGRSEWIRLSVITRKLSQHAPKEKERQERVRMDSIYTALQSGADFDALARQYSEDAQGDKAEWMPLPYLLQEWQTCLASLKKDEVSRPFESPIGIHIVKWTERKSKEQTSAGTSADKEKRMQEVREALLAAALTKMYASSITYTEQDLEAWFKEHRKEYAWDLPHYRGAVIHCRDKKQAKRIKKWLEKYRFTEWKVALSQAESDTLRAETGIFQIGTNQYVDKLVFKCGEYEPLEGFPYTFVMGKKLKKGPETYQDVREQVIKDWREAHQDGWLDALCREYKVEIDEDVLKTVNNDGSY